MAGPLDAPLLDHGSLKAHLPGVLAAWGLRADREPLPVAGGTLNWNFEVRAGGRRYFVRCYRDNLETERIEGEHGLVRWAVERGIPAPAAIPTLDGSTLFVDGDRRWAVLPWMRGAPVERGRLSKAQARALGHAHGRLQATLAKHPDSADARLTMRWDKTQSQALLQELRETAVERRSPAIVHEGLAKQCALLETLDVAPPEAFASMPCQLLQGDFHDQQVLFEGDCVTAIVDWEIWHTDPRAWELVRSLSFSRILETPRLADYLAGYRQHIALDDEEAHLAIRMWLQSRVVGFWAWWAYLKEGNERASEFFPAMVAQLNQLGDGAWRERLMERFVSAAVR